MPPRSFKRRRLSVNEKLEIAKEISGGSTYAELQKKFQIGTRTLNRIKHDAPKLRRKVSEPCLSMNLKSVRKNKFPELEAKLLEFVSLCRQVNKPVTLIALADRVLFVRDR
mmetsp:Transcript_7204/g.15410  ORF Transcript_7204/g.15410 Transcript_7204/m.15410 type:complete len:111 (-) Transcript_7204:524-856(-)